MISEWTCLLNQRRILHKKMPIEKSTSVINFYPNSQLLSLSRPMMTPSIRSSLWQWLTRDRTKNTETKRRWRITTEQWTWSFYEIKSFQSGHSVQFIKCFSPHPIFFPLSFSSSSSSLLLLSFFSFPNGWRKTNHFERKFNFSHFSLSNESHLVKFENHVMMKWQNKIFSLTTSKY